MIIQKLTTVVDLVHLIKGNCRKRFGIINVEWLWANKGNWNVFRIIGAIVIVAGLYMVLWGKSKDQLGSRSDNDRVVPTTQNMATMNERTKTSKQKFVAIDVKSVESTDGTAWR